MPEKTFPLDPALGAGSTASLSLTGTTSADVAAAIAGRHPFPPRPDGTIEIGTIGLALSSGEPLAITAGAVKADASFGVGVAAGVGVYDDGGKALAALGLEETPGLTIDLADTDRRRFLVLRSSYSASGTLSGTHPVGTVGSFTFGLSSKAAGRTAVIHAFDAEDVAPDVMRRGVGAWKLPRHVESADALPPGTWVVAEAEGSLALELGARVGYDFSFVREVGRAGLSGDVGLKLDAAVKATVGFDVSGRYLVVVGREQDAPVLRVRLFKLARRGVAFGFNLKVGVRLIESVLPDTVDDFVEAVFGVHGTQVVSALANLEKWTSSDASVGELVAGLVNERALGLLRASTGIDPGTRSGFERARTTLVDAITRWKKLPDRVSGVLLSVLKGLSEPDRQALLASITLLASDDDDRQKQAFLDLLESRGFDQSPAGRLLIAMADRGLLNLLDRLPEVRRTAAIVADVLDGDVIRRLQDELAGALDLTKLDSVTEGDVDTLDSFLVGRLAAFLDRQIDFAAIDEIRRAIRVVMDKQRDIYQSARKALTARYGAEVAAAWQQTTARTALLDVEFDTSRPEGAALLAAVLRDGNLNGLLASPSTAVRFHSALISHELKRTSTLSVSLPTLAFRTEHVNTSLASVTVEEEAGRLLLYHVDATDTVMSTRRRYRSSLSIALTEAVAVEGSHDLRVHSKADATWAYELRHARAGLRRGELEMYTRPFLEAYMRDRFGAHQQWSQWYTELDQTVEGLLANGPDQFGDALLSLQVSIPGQALQAWVASPLDPVQAAQKISRAIQQSLKTIISHYYLEDPDHLFQQASSAALLAWAGMPPTTAGRKVRNTVVFDDSSKSFYWDWPNRAVRRAQCERGIVAAVLGRQFVAIRQRLVEQDLHRQAAFFDATEVPDWIRAATSDTGDTFLEHLCGFEAGVVDAAVSAFKELRAFASVKRASPQQAVERLAEFGARMAQAFNTLGSRTVFASAPLNAVTQGVFLDATRAIADVDATPRGMLTVTVLEPSGRRAFALESFLAGGTPAFSDIALEQRLVSVET